ncbi:MAG: VacJ family lipoprotein [Pseudomonadota bacterium]
MQQILPRVHALHGQPTGVVALALLVALTLSAATPAMADTADGWEGLNRKTFAFNDWADRRVLRPVAKGYTQIIPKPARIGVHNFFTNLFTPTVVVNQFLQGKPLRGTSDLGRFLLNSSVGIGGLFDVATHVGLPEHQEDFGQTLGVWGVPPGNYTVLPLLGSSNVRDTVSRAVDSMTNPLRFLRPVEHRYSLLALSVIDLRAELLKVDQLVVGDEYVFLREAYSQRREFLINDGEFSEDGFDDDFGDEFGAEFDGEP